MTTYNLGHNVGHTVTVDGNTYGSPFLLESGFTIRPSSIGGVYSGLTSTIGDASITIDGNVYGSAAFSAFAHGRPGGIGVDLTDPGDHLLNNNNVSGGAGGNSNGGGYGGYGGAGGIGLNLVGTGSSNASSNDGAITGGVGGTATTAYGGGAGGVGLNLSDAVLGSIGRIVGGTGGGGNDVGGGYSGGGGAGATLGSGATLNNSGSLQGGTGGSAEYGGTGGAGVSLAAGATLNNQGSHASITGGTGGYGALFGGAGGVGVSIAAGAVFTGTATIHGGAGGHADTQGGPGGAGVDIASGATFTNTGSIVGGNAYAAGGGLFTTYAKAGAGVEVHGGSLFNFGSITAGSSYGGSLGGVYLDGGKVFTDGHIDGGSNSFAVDFGAVASTMSVGTGATFGGDIGGFQSGDVIDLLNVTPQQAQADVTRTSFYNNYGARYVTVAVNTGADGTLKFIQSYGYQTNFHYYTDGHGGTDLTIACFLKGTKIRTFGGETAVEDLDIGHRVITRDGLFKPIKWIGRRAYAGAFAANNRNVMPVRICAGALANGIPHRDLCVSPMHAMYLDGMLIPAIDLVNGTSIVQLKSMETIEYFHVELAEHDVIFAEGAATESYIDDDNRMMFLNARDYYDRYPQEAAGTCQFCAPRVEEGWELEEVRQRLADRAAGIAADEAPTQIAARLSPREQHGGAALG